MKHSLIFVIALAIITSLHSCNEVDNNGKTMIIRDSLINVLPTWQSCHIHVSSDNTDMHITVGDVKLYKASDDIKKQKAQEVAQMVLRIYGKGNYLEKGTLTVTADINNQSETPADGVNVPMDFAALKKTMGQ